jgi:hypothetical protein
MQLFVPFHTSPLVGRNLPQKKLLTAEMTVSQMCISVADLLYQKETVMSSSTQITNQTVVVVSQPDSEPMFSEEFVGMVQDRAYETLRAYLERTKQAGAVQLLDDIIILSMGDYGCAVPWMKNQMMSEAIGQASHHVLSLGGRFGT